MKNIVKFSHALADETRWRILQLIFNEPLCVCELADILDMPQSSVSSHVQVLKKADLLESEKCGKWIYYRAAPHHRNFLLKMSTYLKCLPEQDPVLQKDARNAIKRLAKRETSCCPLPSTLKPFKSLTVKPTSK